MKAEIIRDALLEIIELAEFHTLDECSTEADAMEFDDAHATNNWFIIRAARKALAAL